MDNNTKIQGIYFIYDVNNVLIYIGRSKDIVKRMSFHFGDSIFKNCASNIPCDEFCRYEYVNFDDVNYLRYIEKECIIIYSPKYNFQYLDKFRAEDNVISKIVPSDVAKELEKIRF